MSALRYYVCPFKPCYVRHSNWNQLCEHMKHHLGINHEMAPWDTSPSEAGSFQPPPESPPRSLLRPQRDIPRDVPMDIDDSDLSAIMPSVEPPNVKRYLQRTYGFPSSGTEYEEPPRETRVDSMILRQGTQAQQRRQNQIKRTAPSPQEQFLIPIDIIRRI